METKKRKEARLSDYNLVEGNTVDGSVATSLEHARNTAVGTAGRGLDWEVRYPSMHMDGVGDFQPRFMQKKH